MKNANQPKSAKSASEKLAALATMTDEQLKSLKGGAGARASGNAAADFIIIDLMCW